MADERLRCPRCMKPLDETVRAWIRDAKVEKPAPGTVRISAGPDARCSCGTPIDPAVLMKQLRPDPRLAALAGALMAGAALAWVFGRTWAGFGMLWLAVMAGALSLRRVLTLAGTSVGEFRKRMQRS